MDKHEWPGELLDIYISSRVASAMCRDDDDDEAVMDWFDMAAI